MHQVAGSPRAVPTSMVLDSGLLRTVSSLRFQMRLGPFLSASALPFTVQFVQVVQVVHCCSLLLTPDCVHRWCLLIAKWRGLRWVNILDTIVPIASAQSDFT